MKVKTRESEDQFCLALIKKDPWHIQNMDNPSEELQLEAVRRFPGTIVSIERPTKKVALEAFSVSFTKRPQYKDFFDFGDHLFWALEQDDKEIFIEHLPHYQEELLHGFYFESMCNCLRIHQNEWLEDFIHVLSPLTPEQERIWKSVRLKNIL